MKRIGRALGGLVAIVVIAYVTLQQCVLSPPICGTPQAADAMVCREP